MDHRADVRARRARPLAGALDLGRGAQHAAARGLDEQRLLAAEVVRDLARERPRRLRDLGLRDARQAALGEQRRGRVEQRPAGLLPGRAGRAGMRLSHHGSIVCWTNKSVKSAGLFHGLTPPRAAVDRQRCAGTLLAPRPMRGDRGAMHLSYARGATDVAAARRDHRREPAPHRRAVPRSRGAGRRATRATARPTPSCGTQVDRAARGAARARRRAGRPRRHLGAQPLRVGRHPVRHRAHRRDPRQHQPGLQGGRAARTRSTRPGVEPARAGARVPRQPTTSAMLDEVRARLPALRESLVLEDDWDALPGRRRARRRRRAGRARGDAAARRPDQHPVHVGHHRLPQGRDAVAPQHPQQRLLHRPDAALHASTTASACRCPFYHCFGMVLGNLACVTHGACMVVPGRGFDAAAVLAAVEAERCTSLYGVPTMFIAELEHAGLRALRPVEPAHRDHGRRALPGRGHAARSARGCTWTRSRSCYGMTETAPLSTQTAPDDPLDKRVGTVGRVHPHVEIKIVDPETGRDRPARHAGRAVHARLQRDARLLERPEAHARGDRRGRLDAHRRPRRDGRRRLPEHRRPHQGHDHPRRREHLPARDRGVPARASRASPTRTSSACPSERYGEEVMAWVKLRDGRRADRRRSWSPPAAGGSPPSRSRATGGSSTSFPMTVTGKIQKFRLRELAAGAADLRGLRAGARRRRRRCTPSACRPARCARRSLAVAGAARRRRVAGRDRLGGLAGRSTCWGSASCRGRGSRSAGCRRPRRARTLRGSGCRSRPSRTPRSCASPRPETPAHSSVLRRRSSCTKARSWIPRGRRSGRTMERSRSRWGSVGDWVSRRASAATSSTSMPRATA